MTNVIQQGRTLSPKKTIKRERTCGGDEMKSSLPDHRSKRLKASARERRRRHVLNDALESLRRKVPSANQQDQKLSKIEVLRMAIEYIASLSMYLNQQPSPSQSTLSCFSDDDACHSPPVDEEVRHHHYHQKQQHLLKDQLQFQYYNSIEPSHGDCNGLRKYWISKMLDNPCQGNKQEMTQLAFSKSKHKAIFNEHALNSSEFDVYLRGTQLANS